MTVSSLGGFLYYMIFIDDFSWNTWIFFMKTKNIKVLRLDNGGEYTSMDVSDFCKEVVIKRELSIPYNPQQNGVAERKNRSIVEVSKAMIHDEDLPMLLWGQAFITTLYVQNMTLHQIFGDKTP
jgi:transposase InsO family protein